jgi:hypothetical protein
LVVVLLYLSQLKWREPAGLAQDAEKHKVRTAGFLFFQVNRNPPALQCCANILRT